MYDVSIWYAVLLYVGLFIELSYFRFRISKSLKRQRVGHFLVSQFGGSNSIFEDALHVAFYRQLKADEKGQKLQKQFFRNNKR